MRDHLFTRESSKSPADFSRDLKVVAGKYGFFLSNEATMNMHKTFTELGETMSPDFDLHMIHICKPDKASKSLAGNPERSVLMPKFIMAFSKNGKTQIRFFHYGTETIAEVVNDPALPESFGQTYNKIKEIIDEAIAA